MTTRMAVLLLSLQVWSQRAESAVRVERVETPSAAASAGIRTGDRLLSWQRTRQGQVVARGRFLQPFDIRDFELEQLPRGGTRVILERDGTQITVAPVPGPWGLEAGLDLESELQRRYDRGLARARAHDIPGALEVWRPLAVDLERGRQVAAAIWLCSRIGTLLIDPVGTGAGIYSKEWVEGKGVDDADMLFAEAARLAKQVSNRRLEAMVHEAAGAAWRMADAPFWFWGRVSLGRVRKSFARALELRRQLDPSALSVAAVSQALAITWIADDDPKEHPNPNKDASSSRSRKPSDDGWCPAVTRTPSHGIRARGCC
jgi:hypothetical protein